MCDFKKWLQLKYFKTNIDSELYHYWCDRMAQAYNEGERSAAITILEDYNEGLIWLSPSDSIILQSWIDSE